MNLSTPFLIKDVAQLRSRIRAMENGDGGHEQDERLWTLLKNCARSAPDKFPWFTPFVALMTMEEQDIQNAKSVLKDYVEKLEPLYFTSGLQYHFWCFAFPHAKWAMYFQWLCTMGVFNPEEQTAITEKLVSYQFLNFFYGMRTKPEPECIDNQTMSLCLSNTLIGYLFSSGENPSSMAQIMLEEGLRRLPDTVGGIPSSGYNGEGSTYMDCVVGPAIPLIVELMEAITGRTDVFHEAFAPNGVTPEQILLMVSREWMPGGLLLPWDNYGYKYGVRAPISYAAIKSGKDDFRDILSDAVWSYDVGVGWAYDDLVWTFIWWPDDNEQSPIVNRQWSHHEVGGAITAGQNQYYLMQMWDRSEPVVPTRSHVNPNAVLLNAYGVPLSLDGSASKSCTRFQFEDTWREVQLGVGEPTRYNYGDGCGGAHSILLVDNWEGMRAMTRYSQFTALELESQNGSLAADVTPIYRERFDDAVKVRRRSSAACDRFFVIEDLACFEQNHNFTSRFVLRPDIVYATGNEVKVKTSEGVTLHLIDLLEHTTVHSEKIDESVYSYGMDPATLLVDFNGDASRRLFIAFMSRAFEPVSSVEGWHTIYDDTEQWDIDEAQKQLAISQHIVPFKLPAYMEKPLPIVKRWWYRKIIRRGEDKSWLQLPRGMHSPKCWINHREVDLTPFRSMLLAPVVPIQEDDGEELEVVIRCDVPANQFDGDASGATVGINGGVYLCAPCEEERILNTSFDGQHIKVITNHTEYVWPYQLMEA